jgi:hypothetical protein
VPSFKAWVAPCVRVTVFSFGPAMGRAPADGGKGAGRRF